jgi:SAM-dependent methyltransferase
MAAKRVDQERLSTDPEEIVQTVKDRYGAIAAASSSCCGPSVSCCGPSVSGCEDPTTAAASDLGYTPVELGLLPDGANLGLGCGAPVGVLELNQGETVLDLGSGPGMDALLAARQVGPTGHVIGVDMTNEMIHKARANASTAGLTQVEFREGRLENLPIESSSVDAVTSNCVINLVPDKAAVFREIHRVLRPGGRMVISDVILDGELPETISSDVLAYVGCVAGAMQRDDYFRLLEEAGLESIEIVKDVDFLAVVGDNLPAELRLAADAAGLKIEDVRGLVRSVTYRARKR